MISTPDLKSRNPGSLDIWGPGPHRHHMEKRNRVKRMPTDKSCWTCKIPGEEVKIKKSAIFQTRNRLGLPDVSFCFSMGSPDAKIIGIVALGILP